MSALGPALRAPACTRSSSATTTTGPSIPTTSPTRRRARTRRPTTRSICCTRPRAHWLAGIAYHCYAGDQSADRTPQGLSGQGDLVHRVLRLARPDRPARAGLLRHAEVARAQSHPRRAPQLGPVDRQLEPRARPVRRPAQQRLRHLHRRRHGRPWPDGHPRRRVLHARPPRPVRRARSGADRKHVVRHDRLERRDHGRRVPQPGRLDGSGRPQRERRPAQPRRRRGRRVIRLHAARRSARHVHLAGVARVTRAATAGRRPHERHGDSAGGQGAAKAVDDDASTRSTTGAAQQPGQRLQIDLGCDAGAARSSSTPARTSATIPRGYEVATSTDGAKWSTPVAGAGTGQLTTIELPHHPLRYVRVVQTGSAPQWWSVADVRAYR